MHAIEPGARISALCLVILSSACGAASNEPETHAAGAGGSTTVGNGGTISSAGASSTAGSSSDGGLSASGGSAAQAGTSPAGVGGTIGTAGNGGSGGQQPPPKVVGACNDLGAIDEFQDITPPPVKDVNFGVVNVLLDPTVSGTIYVGTDKSGIWKSTDCGSTWEKTNTGSEADIIDGGTQWAMAIDPVDPQVIYAGSFGSANQTLHKSVDGGKNFDSLWPAGSEVEENVEYNTLQMFTIDRTDHNHVLATMHANCKDPTKTGPRPYDIGCLVETTDAGQTWRIIKGPTGGWSEAASPYLFGATTMAMATEQNGVYYSGDGGTTWTKLSVNGAADAPYWTEDGHMYTGSDYGINYVSPDGSSWTKIEGSPVAWGITGDGNRLFAGMRFLWGGSTDQPYYTAMAADDTKWQNFSSPPMHADLGGAVVMKYDSDHHLLYSANQSSGLFRMVTQ